MGRPQKVIQQKKNGIYFVQLHLNGRRVTRSLETRDTVDSIPATTQLSGLVSVELLSFCPLADTSLVATTITSLLL